MADNRLPPAERIRQFLVIGSLKAQIVGVRLGHWYVSLAGPHSRPLYSERNRCGVSVLPLFGGWRIRLRRDAA